MVQLYGGSLGDFADSMAEEIEIAMDEVRVEAGLEQIPPNEDPEERKYRRILYVAIARGVIKHLQNQQQAFEITVNVPPHQNTPSHDTVTTHPTIYVKVP